MTSYFDTAHTDLSKLQKDVKSLFDNDVIAWEQKIIYACTLVAEWPGCPGDIRDRIHGVIIEHSVTQVEPHCDNPRADSESDEDGFSELHKLSWELHTVFHDLASKNLPGFNDKPWTPPRALCAQGEDRRDGLLRVKFPRYKEYCEKLEADLVLEQKEYVSLKDGVDASVKDGVDADVSINPIKTETGVLNADTK